MLVRAYIASSRTWVQARHEYWKNCPSGRQLVWKKPRRTESPLPPATNSLPCLSKVRECSTADQMPLKLCRGKAKIWGSTLAKVVTSHHTSTGSAIDVTVNPILRGCGISSAIRQKTVGFRLFCLRWDWIDRGSGFGGMI